MRPPEFLYSGHIKTALLSAVRTDRLYPPGDTLGTYSCRSLGRPEGHSAAEKIDSIGHRTRDLPAFRTLPQRTAPLRKQN